MNKAYVLTDLNDGSKLKVEFRPDGIVECPVDPITGKLERAEWLELQDFQDEFGVIQKQAVVNQTTKDAILSAEAATKTANEYKEKRQVAYPPIGDQLDALYKKLTLNDSTDWDAIAEQIAQVKLDNPKPE